MQSAHFTEPSCKEDLGSVWFRTPIGCTRPGVSPLYEPTNVERPSVGPFQVVSKAFIEQLSSSFLSLQKGFIYMSSCLRRQPNTGLQILKLAAKLVKS